MVEDIRKKVAADSNIVKKLERAIPGFKGYRAKEDIRESDKLLRSFLADELRSVRATMQEAMDAVSENADLQNTGKVQSAIDNLDYVIEKTAHAEAGYAAYDAAITVKEDALNKLYDYDNGLFIAVPKIKEAAGAVKSAAVAQTLKPADSNAVVELIKGFQKLLEDRKHIMLGV
jgi:hypothetical protein